MGAGSPLLTPSGPTGISGMSGRCHYPPTSVKAVHGLAALPPSSPSRVGWKVTHPRRNSRTRLPRCIEGIEGGPPHALARGGSDSGRVPREAPHTPPSTCRPSPGPDATAERTLDIAAARQRTPSHRPGWRSGRRGRNAGTSGGVRREARGEGNRWRVSVRRAWREVGRNI